MKTAARFDQAEYAYLARSVLANHEIESFVFDENIVQLDWFYSWIVGGVRLVVAPEDQAEAVRILKSCSRVEMDGKYELLSIPAGHLLVLFLSFFCNVPFLVFGRHTYYIDRETGKMHSSRPDD